MSTNREYDRTATATLEDVQSLVGWFDAGGGGPAKEAQLARAALKYHDALADAVESGGHIGLDLRIVSAWALRLSVLRSALLDKGSPELAREVGEVAYDIRARIPNLDRIR